MTIWTLLFGLLTALPPVEVSTLSGEQHVGTLERLTADEVALKTPDGVNRIPATELLTIRIPASNPPPAAAMDTVELKLVDGSLLHVTGYTSTTAEARCMHSILGELKLPVTLISSLRFAGADTKVDADWKELQSKSPRLDQIAIRKDAVLDRLDGVVGSLDATTVRFQLDGDEIPVKRERVFGIVYSKREPVKRVSATVELSNGDRLSIRSLLWESDQWAVTLGSGPRMTAPATGIQVIDYSQGKIAYLSNLEPRNVDYTPFFEIVWDYRRDRGIDSQPLMLAGKTYPKGLSIHSQTVLAYRLGGDYRRFQAVAGINEKFRGNVELIVKGDGRVLFQNPVRIDQPPQPLDLDVAGVVELEITVGFGDDELDIGDWLHLADAKVLK